ncbi:hypothetical protein ABET52_12945 [Saccharococcus caldoxylosilyticus]|jgi:hypothetical protein|uniref:hypothetical protein n=1 Tax=Saccharococcus caldoxylosilyticus TaxID=81408 RepID=UPI0002DBF59C|nr:hypothetical protein [Parageobacillus caldoxylosilyticus]BDG35986.1 hypothetical protein PcaKH15_18920 [Parageobacillus caldoxylosilyticus]BDG39768.1 hypothetical protein PcaKH16_19070 [Parageobacillus caldoxylosilyticus]BDG43538.1 hypothetical protein PcaKH35_18830 [Parageobacillus caldoxylosilyticus]
MFDPTAFDNLKTVLEGAVYDLDLEGEIVVIDRHDLVDLAHFSRTYTITFCLASDHTPHVSCTIRLEMDLEQIAKELLRQTIRPGCTLSITFSLPIRQTAACLHIERVLRQVWGEERTIRQTLSHEFLHETPSYRNEATIEFGRLIYEDNVADLEEMIPYMIASLEQLQKFSDK